jgi:hypothetical protein
MLTLVSIFALPYVSVICQTIEEPFSNRSKAFYQHTPLNDVSRKYKTTQSIYKEWTAFQKARVTLYTQKVREERKSAPAQNVNVGREKRMNGGRRDTVSLAELRPCLSL